MADPEVADVDAEVEADVEAEVEGLAGRLDVVPRDQKVVGRVVVAQKSSTLCTTHVDVSPFGNGNEWNQDKCLHSLRQLYSQSDRSGLHVDTDKYVWFKC